MLFYQDLAGDELLTQGREDVTDRLSDTEKVEECMEDRLMDAEENCRDTNTEESTQDRLQG